ncbi:cytochrome P450 [Novosphingobium colocasiae]|nr:cytochrome P450 [Novosphingobium colocasiae]
MMDNSPARIVDPQDPELSPERLKERFGRDFFRDFDIDDPNLNTHFHEVIDLMVQKCPVAHSKVGTGYYVFSTEEAVRKIGQDWQTFSSAKGYIPNRPDDMPLMIPVEQDPPNHTAWRRVLNPHMGPKVMDAIRDDVAREVNALIDKFIDRGECEFIGEMAGLLPGRAFFIYVLGVPVVDLPELVHDVDKSLFGPLDERTAYHKKVYDYLEKFLKEREAMEPQGDIVDTILKGVTYGDGSEASWEHKVSVVLDLTYGGISTTIYALGSTARHLADHPEQRQQLLDNPEWIENAVEEFVRAYSPVVAMGRTCTRDTEVEGVQLKEGDYVMMGFSSAGRDPRTIADPKALNFAEPTIHHPTFGVGPHRCIGSHLARMELAVFTREWLRRIPHFRVKAGTEPVYETGFLRAMSSLWLSWDK